MQVVGHSRKSPIATDRAVKCVFCRDRIPFSDPTRTSDVCKLCASEIEEFGWRTVYDRDLNVGQIPANLRAAYKI